MFKCAVSFLLLLTISLQRIANGLECYVTSITRQNVKNNQVLQHGFDLQDCRDFVRNALKIQGVWRGKLPDLKYNCYTLHIHMDAIDTRLKGCVPEDSCDVLAKSIEYKTLLKAPTFKIRNITCVECTTNGCNDDNVPFAIRSKIAVKNGSSTLRNFMNFLTVSLPVLVVAQICAKFSCFSGQ